MDNSGKNQFESEQDTQFRKDLYLMWKSVVERIKVKQPFWLIISIILIFVGIWFIFDRLELIRVGEHVIGKVTNITSTNSRCGSKNNKYDCTEFTGYVDFMSLRGEKGDITIGGGSSRGHDQSTDTASIQIGQDVKVIYDPSNIRRAYEDTLWGIWGTPIMVFVFHITSFFTAFAEPKRRYT